MSTASAILTLTTLGFASAMTMVCTDVMGVVVSDDVVKPMRGLEDCEERVRRWAYDAGLKLDKCLLDNLADLLDEAWVAGYVDSCNDFNLTGSGRGFSKMWPRSFDIDLEEE